MLKIGIIGLGDIATKAYLPVISGKKIEAHLFTRNQSMLEDAGARYRFSHLHKTFDSLLNSGINAAFVHSAASTHDEIVRQLLINNIHVYVDKPLAFHYAACEKLIKLANKNNRILCVGFNRRFAPSYQQLKLSRNPSMIVMQKNRKSLPGDIRTFVFEDFIHVVDTLLYFLDQPVEKLIVNGKQIGGQLYHVVVQLVCPDGTTAIGIMNRDSGTTEERLEVFTSAEKLVVHNLTDSYLMQDKNEIRMRTDDWQNTLHKRGFEQITEHFLQRVQTGSHSQQDHESILLTHRICEQIVEDLSR
jgi:virulence factor